MTDSVRQLKLRFLTHFPSFRIFPLVLFHPQLNSFNPSIAIHEGEIYFSVRHSNMLASGNMRHYRTFNKVIVHNASAPAEETSFGTLRIPASGEFLECRFLDGRMPVFEDIRIFRSRGRWFGLGAQLTGSVLTNNGNVMHLILFDDRFRPEAAIPLPSPIGAASEKNWVPLCRNTEYLIVYRPSPLDLFHLDFESGRMSPLVLGRKPAMDGSTCSEAVWPGVSKIAWSGSSQFVPYGDHHLGVVHRKFLFSDELLYEHAFQRIGKDFELQISKPFHFLSFGIEFCAGLAIRDDKVIMSFGSHNDTRAYVCTLSRGDMEQLFSP
jgi:hypothetical protein